MRQRRTHRFAADLEIIGVNPFVFVPARVLAALLREFGRDKGPVPIRGTLNGEPFRQTLVRFRGEWRLYVNTAMLKQSPRRVGERIRLEVAIDREPRVTEMPPAFAAALDRDEEARRAFEALTPSRRQEIVRYLARLKSADALERNIQRALRFLAGVESFVGRTEPTPKVRESRVGEGVKQL